MAIRRRSLGIIGLLLCHFSRVIEIGSPPGPMTHLATDALILVLVMDSILCSRL